MDLSKLQEMIEYAEKKADQMAAFKESVDIKHIADVSFFTCNVEVEIEPTDWYEDNYTCYLSYEDLMMSVDEFKAKINARRKQREEEQKVAQEREAQLKAEKDKANAEKKLLEERALYEQLKAKFEKQ